MNTTQLNELLYQGLETELGGVQIYTKAIQCAVNADLKKEWENLEQTQKHVSIMKGVLNDLGLEIDKETPGREVCRHTGESLIRAMELAQYRSQAGRGAYIIIPTPTNATAPPIRSNLSGVTLSTCQPHSRARTIKNPL